MVLTYLIVGHGKIKCCAVQIQICIQLSKSELKNVKKLLRQDICLNQPHDKSGRIIAAVLNINYMELPELQINPRYCKLKKYGRELREEVVMTYLFEGLSNRKLDEIVLGVDSKETNGYDSLGILRYYGLGGKFKGIFKGMTPNEVINQIPNDPQYDTIYDIISRTTDELFVESGKWVKGLTKVRLVNTRVNQDKFRKMVLNAYGGSCCITGISEPRLLRASHIKPWCDSDEYEKTDVRNGLCLNALHDAAFDVGLMTIEPSCYSIRLSSKIEDCMSPEIYEDYFRRYDGKTISLPEEDECPKQEYLDYHKLHIFDKNRQYLKLEIEIQE